MHNFFNIASFLKAVLSRVGFSILSVVSEMYTLKEASRHLLEVPNELLCLAFLCLLAAKYLD